MKIGWVDFSKKDRDAAIEAIRLLRGQGAVDELGVGPIRDAFAEAFFPGTSTLQTRAKYFLIVPYIILDILGDKVLARRCDNAARVIEEIVGRERDVARSIYKEHKDESNDGLIGRSLLPDGWVIRAPSELYWSGIRKFGIYSGKHSLYGCISEALQRLKEGDGVSLGNNDDCMLSGGHPFVCGSKTVCPIDIGECYSKDAVRNLRSLDLTRDEAAFLKERIVQSDATKGSLLAFLVQNPGLVKDIDETINDDAGVDAPNEDEKPCRFAIFSEKLMKCQGLSQENKRLIKLANDFNKLVYAARILYNKMLGNEDEHKSWKNIQEGGALPSYATVDMNDVYGTLCKLSASGRISFRYSGSSERYKFFANLSQEFLNSNIEKAERLIEEQEKLLKKNRAKLNNSSAISSKTWVGGKWLDYRMPDAMRIVKDIVLGEVKDA